MTYQEREYLWDRVRGGPCIVVGIKSDKALYVVAEIVGSPPKLGRVASRTEGELCRYVKAIIPEDEAFEAETILREATDWDYNGPLAKQAAGRIQEAREKRGVA